MGATSKASAVFILCLQIAGILCTSNATTTTLHLLTLVPLGHENGEATNCLDLGEQLIPTAKIAAQRINANPEFFKNSSIKLEIINASINRCSDPSIATSLASLASNTTNEDYNIVGIIGLVCPSSLLSLSPLASLPMFNKLQISSSTTSPSIVGASRKDSVGLLYQIAPSTAVFNRAVLALMKSKSWRNISVIRHTDIFSISVEHDNLVRDFRMRIGIGEYQELGISVNSETGSGITTFVQAVKNSGVRVIYTSVTVPEARELLCQSYQDNVSWPNYLWIFYDHSLEELLHNTTECSLQMMQRAVEGILLLYHDVSSDPARQIDYAEYTYGEYFKMYNESLAESTRPICNTEPQILSANALHDSVLAFAYALNKTLPEAENIDCLGKIGEIGCPATNILNSYVQSASFMGAGGEIAFNNSTHELIADTRVNIYQVINGALLFLAHFNGSVTFNVSAELSNFSYTFERMIVRIPLALPVSTLVVSAAFLVITIIVLVLFIYYREAPDVKAMSPFLSYIIVFSCLLLYASVVGAAIRNIIGSRQAYAVLCASEQVFFVLGMQLIFATLCIRLLRVSRIFFNFDPVGETWSDKYLAVYIGITAIITVFLLIIWLAVGDFAAGEDIRFLPSANPPHYTVTLSCSAKHRPVFLALTFGYIVIYMAIAVVLAIRTRKVRIDVFRDTKSVNVFIFCSTGILSLCIPLSFITASLEGVTNMIISYLFLVTSLIAVAVACICLLFLPKIHLARTAPTRPRSKSTGAMSSRGRLSSCNKPPEEGLRNSAHINQK